MAALKVALYDYHAVFAAEIIGPPFRCHRIIPPYPVDNETILMFAFLKHERARPRALTTLYQGIRSRVPVVEATCDKHLRRFRGTEFERSLPLRRLCLCLYS